MAQPISVLVCTGCDKGIDICSGCDRADCPAGGICYSCLVVELHVSLREPHEHGG
jgi:hypothetical protein